MFPKTGPVPTYAIFYIAGIIVHLLLTLRAARPMGLRRGLAVGLSACYATGMLVGAKALYDLGHDRFQPACLIDIQHYMAGGLWGGPLAYLALAVPLVLLRCRDRKAGLDLVALTLPLPMVFAKLGCFMEGCCGGRATSCFWGMCVRNSKYGAADQPVHPTQLYEIAVLLGIMLAFRWLREPRYPLIGPRQPTRRRGTLLAWFLLLYGIGRSVAEIFRADRPASVGPLTASQSMLLATAVVAAAIVAVQALRRRRQHPLDQAGLPVPAQPHVD